VNEVNARRRQGSYERTKTNSGGGFNWDDAQSALLQKSDNRPQGNARKVVDKEKDKPPRVTATRAITTVEALRITKQSPASQDPPMFDALAGPYGQERFSVEAQGIRFAPIDTAMGFQSYIEATQKTIFPTQ
jgi:hypothetical protein